MAEPEVDQPKESPMQRLERKLRWESQTIKAARNGDVEYFRTAFAATDDTPNGQETRIKLITIAMVNEQMATWVNELPLAEILLADNRKVLQKCFDYINSDLYGYHREFYEIIDMIGAKRQMIEMLVEKDNYNITEVYNYFCNLSGDDKQIITREFCLSDNGSFLHMVWRKMQKKSLQRKKDDEENAKFEAEFEAEPLAGPEAEPEDEKRREKIRIKNELWPIKFIINKCKLSKSDLASVGLPWPWQWLLPRLS